MPYGTPKRPKPTSSSSSPPLRCHLALNRRPRCEGPGCGKEITPPRSGIYIVRHNEATPFCSPGCFTRTLSLGLEQEWANAEVKKQDLLAYLGYGVRIIPKIISRRVSAVGSRQIPPAPGTPSGNSDE